VQLQHDSRPSGPSDSTNDLTFMSLVPVIRRGPSLQRLPRLRQSHNLKFCVTEHHSPVHKIRRSTKNLTYGNSQLPTTGGFLCISDGLDSERPWPSTINLTIESPLLGRGSCRRLARRRLHKEPHRPSPSTKNLTLISICTQAQKTSPSGPEHFWRTLFVCCFAVNNPTNKQSLSETFVIKDIGPPR